VALLALLVTSCTSTGTGLDGKPLQMTSASDGSVIADTLQSAADQTAVAEAAKASPAEEKKAEAKPGETKPAVVAEAANTSPNCLTRRAAADPGSSPRPPADEEHIAFWHVRRQQARCT